MDKNLDKELGQILSRVFLLQSHLSKFPRRTWTRNLDNCWLPCDYLHENRTWATWLRSLRLSHCAMAALLFSDTVCLTCPSPCRQSCAGRRIALHQSCAGRRIALHQSCAGHRIALRQSCAGRRIAPVNPVLGAGLFPVSPGFPPSNFGSNAKGRMGKIKLFPTTEYTSKQALDPVVPLVPCTGIFLGPSKSGKTVALISLILEQYRGVFERIYIFSPSVNIDDGWIPVKKYIEEDLWG